MDCAHDVRDRQEVQRAIEESEGRALALRVECYPGGKLLAALDIRGGQCAQRASDFGETEVGQMPRLE